MRRVLTIVLLLVAFSVAVVLPAGTQPAAAAPRVSAPAQVAHTAAFDKTRFLIHLGVAAFLVHYIYKKYKEGKLSHFHFFTDVKAAAAALIAYHELKVDYNIAKSSHSKTLHFLIAPIGALDSAVNSAKSKLSHGDTSGLNSLESQQGSLQSLASKHGFSFKDVAPSGFSGF